MSFAYTVTGGTPPYVFDVSAGALPPGVVLDTATGVLSGTPTTVGNYAWTMRVTDSVGVQSTKASTSHIASDVVSPFVFTGNAGDGRVGDAYSYTYTLSDGTPPYNVALLSGTLPTGLSISTAGVLSGTPTTTGSFSWILRGQDSGGEHIDLPDSSVIAAAVPALPVTAGLVLWLDARDITVANGAIVPAWVDRSTAATVVTGGSTKPLFASTGMGGKPSINASNGGYFGAAINWSGATGATMFAIFKNQTSAITPMGLGFGPNGGAYTSWITFNSNVMYDANLSSGRVSADITSRAAEVLSPSMYTVYSGASGGKVRLNAVDTISNPNAFLAPPSYFGIGQLVGLSGGDNRITAQNISAVLVYKRVLTSAEILQVEAFLRTVWL